jgi:hypothetical protein
MPDRPIDHFRRAEELLAQVEATFTSAPPERPTLRLVRDDPPDDDPGPAPG